MTHQRSDIFPSFFQSSSASSRQNIEKLSRGSLVHPAGANEKMKAKAILVLLAIVLGHVEDRVTYLVLRYPEKRRLIRDGRPHLICLSICYSVLFVVFNFNM